MLTVLPVWMVRLGFFSSDLEGRVWSESDGFGKEMLSARRCEWFLEGGDD